MLGIKMANRKNLDKQSENCRMGWMVTMVGLVLTAWTVHYWNSLYVLFTFLIGSGVWVTATPGAPQATLSSSGASADIRHPRRGTR